MPLIQWSEAFSVGNTQIDQEHKKLVDLINKLHQAMKEGKAKSQIGTILTELVHYTMTHFDNEEALMLKAGYPDMVTHKKLHLELKTQVQELLKKHNSGSITLGIETANFLKDWLQKHILEADKKYKEYI